MIVKKADSVPARNVEMKGAQGVRVRVLFGPSDDAPTFAMRVFEMSPGGHTPYHSHPFEHEVMVLNGKVGLVSEGGMRELQREDAVLIVPGERHQFRNLSGNDEARFLCLVPVEYQN